MEYRPMGTADSQLEPSGPPPAMRWFTSTHWSVVLAARDDSSRDAQEALENLCRIYWPPLYDYVRRLGHGPHDAEDLTQEFFSRLLAKHYLREVQRERGKFRSFLLAALRHFLANEWDRAHAVKRGGRLSFISLDSALVEAHDLEAASLELPPEKLFEQRWALALLEQVLARLRTEVVAAGKEPLFTELKVFLMGEKPSESYAEMAARLHTTEAALKMAVQRLRHRYRELLHEEIAHTVASPDEIDGELNALFAALS